METLLVVQERLAQLDPNNRDHLAEIQGLKTQEIELKLQQQQQQREQKQVDYIDGLLQAILNLGLFDAIVPQPEDGERMHEYTERKKEFNLLQYDFVKEQLLAQNALHNEDMAAKDEKIRIVTRQGLDAENQLAEAHREIAEHIEKENTWADDEERLETKIRDLEGVQGQTQTLLDMANDRLAELQAQLEKAQQSSKPSEYAAPSQPLQDRVASLKARSVDEMISRFNARQKEENQVQLPDMPQVLPFPGDTEPESASDPVPTPEAIAEVGEQFQTETGLEMALPTPGVEETVSRQEFQKLKSDVEALKRKVGWEAA